MDSKLNIYSNFEVGKNNEYNRICDTLGYTFTPCFYFLNNYDVLYGQNVAKIAKLQPQLDQVMNSFPVLFFRLEELSTGCYCMQR